MPPQKHEDYQRKARLRPEGPLDQPVLWAKGTVNAALANNDLEQVHGTSDDQGGGGPPHEVQAEAQECRGHHPREKGAEVHQVVLPNGHCLRPIRAAGEC
jgi:hypothetical protein